MVRLGAQTIQNVVTYTAVIGVDNRDMALLPGMTANLQIVTDERRDVLRVPNAALRFRPPSGAAAAPTPAAGAARTSRPAGRAAGGRWRRLRERIDADVQPTPRAGGGDRARLGGGALRLSRRGAGLSDEERRAALRAGAGATCRQRIAAALDPERRARFEAHCRARGAGRRCAATASPGRVYVLGEDGRRSRSPSASASPTADTTEVLAGDLREGSRIVTGGGPRARRRAEPAPTRPRGPRLF